EIDFALIARLGVTEHDRAEGIGFLLGIERKVDAFGKWSGRGDAGEAKARGRAIGFVDIVKLRQVVFVQRRSKAPRFDDEKDRIVADRHLISAVRVRMDDALAVGDAHAGNSSLTGVTPTVLVGVLV